MKGSKIYEAAKFLINTLAGAEMASNDVIQKAKDAGITFRTFCYARRALHVRARKKSNVGWMMSLPENAWEYFAGMRCPSPADQPMRLIGKGTISTDFIHVISVEDDEPVKTPSPQLSGRLRIKIGEVEIEADEGLPPEQLIALMRELGRQ